VYLLTRASAGNITYAGSRNSAADLLADQKAYYTDGFALAHQRLGKEGVIERAIPKPPAGETRARFEQAQAKLQEEILAMWGSVHGLAHAHIDVPASGTFDGVAITLVKELPASSIYNTTAADYVFDLELKQPVQKATLIVEGSPRDAKRTNLLVKINGQTIMTIAQALPEGRLELDVPAGLITAKTVVTIAYFFDDSYARTRFDNSVIVKRMALALQ